jgi:hypothetical protein
MGRDSLSVGCDPGYLDVKRFLQLVQIAGCRGEIAARPRGGEVGLGAKEAYELAPDGEVENHGDAEQHYPSDTLASHSLPVRALGGDAMA